MAILFFMLACSARIAPPVIPRTIGLQDITDHTRALQMKVVVESTMEAHPVAAVIHKHCILPHVPSVIVVNPVKMAAVEKAGEVGVIRLV